MFSRVRFSRRLALQASVALFLLYAAVFPGSTVTVALNRVPAWGIWMGNALLLLQGAIMVVWLAGRYGWRGVFASALVGIMALLVEYVGENTGLPFGRYSYTEVLQPQVLGSVPLAICSAWITVVPAAFEVVRGAAKAGWARWMLPLTATLVLLLDLQIEPVATLINSYWVWHDSGLYYGVPTLNFVSWWLVGFGMAWVLSQVLPRDQPAPSIGHGGARREVICRNIPLLLYLMSTTMFAAANICRGYPLAGLIGVAVLVAALVWLTRWRVGGGLRPEMRRTAD